MSKEQQKAELYSFLKENRRGLPWPVKIVLPGDTTLHHKINRRGNYEQYRARVGLGLYRSALKRGVWVKNRHLAERSGTSDGWVFFRPYWYGANQKQENNKKL